MEAQGQQLLTSGQRSWRLAAQQAADNTDQITANGLG